MAKKGIESRGAFDAEAYAKQAGAVGDGIFESLKRKGIDPDNMPEITGAIRKVTKDIDKLVETYGSAAPKTRKSIERQMQGLRKALSVDLSARTEQAAAEYLEAHPETRQQPEIAAAPAVAEAAPAPAPAAVETAPSAAPAPAPAPAPAEAAASKPEPATPPAVANEVARPISTAEFVTASEKARGIEVFDPASTEPNSQMESAPAPVSEVVPPKVENPAEAGKTESPEAEAPKTAFAATFAKPGALKGRAKEVKPSDVEKARAAAVRKGEAVVTQESIDKDKDEMSRLAQEVGGRKGEASAYTGEKTEGKKEAPADLKSIFGDREVPKGVEAMYAKLKGEGKRKSYLEKVAAEEAEKVQRKEAREKAKKAREERAAQKPTREAKPRHERKERKGPRNVYELRLTDLENALKERYPEGMPVDMQKKYDDLTQAQLKNISGRNAAEMEKTSAEVEAFIAETSPSAAGETVAAEEVVEEGVDTRGHKAPQYGQKGLERARSQMQKEMNALEESKPAQEAAAPRPVFVDEKLRQDVQTRVTLGKELGYGLPVIAKMSHEEAQKIMQEGRKFGEPPRAADTQPAKVSSAAEQPKPAAVSATEPAKEYLQRLWREIRDLEAEAKQPGARKDIEADILKREDELRALEAAQKLSVQKEANTKRAGAIRERLATLEREAANPAQYPHDHDALESEVLALEKELKELEAPMQAKAPKIEPEPKPAPEPEPEPALKPAAPPEVPPVRVVSAEKNPKDVLAGGVETEVREDGMEYVVPLPSPSGERTPKEWKARLREAVGKLVGGAKEKLGMSARGEKLQENLAGRLVELDAEAKKIGWIEKSFRWMGETYNKMPLRYKIATGVLLGVGAVVTSGVSITAPLAFMGGIAAQRVVGMAGMFLNLEKKLQAQPAFRIEKGDDAIEGSNPLEYVVPVPTVDGKRMKKNEDWWKWSGKNTAMLGAALWSIGLGYAVKEGVEWASQTETAHNIQRWLGDMLGHHTTPGVSPNAAPAAAVAEAANAAPVSEVPHGLATEPPGTPGVSIEAGKGHGYEWMMKRLWESPQLANMNAQDYYNPNVSAEQQSDIYKLLTATPENIDKIVHQIASDPQHGFFNPDGTSVQIDQTARMTIGTDGQVHMGDAGHADMIHAAEDMKVTPAYPPEAAAPKVPDMSMRVEPHPDFPHEVTRVDAGDMSGDYPVGEQPAAAPEAIPETQPPAEVVEKSIAANPFGLVVPVAETHIYADAGDAHTFVFGGSPHEQAEAIHKFLVENSNKVIYGTDSTGTYRVPWHLVDGKEVVAGPPMKTGGLFGFGSTLMKPPGAAEFEKLIK